MYLSPLNDQFEPGIHITNGFQTNSHDGFVVVLSKGNLRDGPKYNTRHGIIADYIAFVTSSWQ